MVDSKAGNLAQRKAAHLVDAMDAYSVDKKVGWRVVKKVDHLVDLMVEPLAVNLADLLVAKKVQCWADQTVYKKVERKELWTVGPMDISKAY